MPRFTVSKGITEIGSSAFQGCGQLATVTIPASVTRIGLGVFKGCTALASIDVDPASRDYASDDGVLFNAAMTTLLRYPRGKAGAYSVPDGVTNITGQFCDWFGGCVGAGAFDHCQGLTSIIIPSSMSEIGAGAFSGCSALTTAIFLGDAPRTRLDSFANTGPSFTIYYLSCGRGYSSPTWHGYRDYGPVTGNAPGALNPESCVSQKVMDSLGGETVA